MPPKPPASRARMAAITLATALLAAGGSAAYTAPADQRVGPSVAPVSGGTVGRPYVKTELLFGTVKPNGGPPVSDREFHAFVDEFVTPRFPGGLTIENAYGQYRDAHGTVEHERSYRITLLHPRSEAAADSRRIQEIRAAYDERFAQESVARVDDNELVDF